MSYADLRASMGRRARLARASIGFLDLGEVAPRLPG
jgi:hypothetical protein